MDQQKVNNVLFFYLDNGPSIEKDLEKLKNAMRTLVAEQKEGEPFFLATPYNNPREFIELKEALNFIDDLETGPWFAKYSDYLSLKDALQNEQSTKVKSIIISDFDSSFFDIKSKTNGLGTLIKIPNRTELNVSVDTAYLLEGMGINSSVVKLGVELSSNLLAERSYSLDLFHKDQLISSAQVNFNESRDASVEFEISNSDIEDAVFRIEDESLSFDNQLHVRIPRSNEIIKVLLCGVPNKYIESVFESDDIYEIKLSNDLSQDLSPYDLIVINGWVAQANQNLNLKTYVESGGNLLLIPSDAESQIDFGFLGASQWSLLINEEQRISEINFNHPLYRNVYTKVPKNPIEPKLTKFYQLGSDANTEIILGSEKKQAILTQKQLGEGQMFQFALPISEKWTELPLVGYLFYPSLSNMALSGRQNQPLYGWLNPIYQPVNIENVSNSKAEVFELRQGDLLFTTEVINRFGESFIVPDRQLSNPGHYLLSSSSQDVQQLVALNLPRIGGDLSFIPNDVLQSIADSTGMQFLNYNSNNFRKEVEEGKLKGQLWKRFLLFALIFILIEIFLLRFL